MPVNCAHHTVFFKDPSCLSKRCAQTDNHLNENCRHKKGLQVKTWQLEIALIN